MDGESTKNEEPLWKSFLQRFNPEDDFWEQQSDFIEMFIKKRKKKKKGENDEEIGYYYNVGIYQILPYPPGTKDVRSSFVHRTQYVSEFLQNLPEKNI